MGLGLGLPFSHNLAKRAGSCPRRIPEQRLCQGALARPDRPDTADEPPHQGPASDEIHRGDHPAVGMAPSKRQHGRRKIEDDERADDDADDNLFPVHA